MSFLVLIANQALSYTMGGHEAIPRSRKDGTSSIGYMYVERSVAMTIPTDGSIQAWKLYADSAADVTMMIVRPVTGTTTAYTIIGQNVIKTPAGTTEIVTVPSFDRINVKAGDVVAWYYLPGSDPTVQ